MWACKTSPIYILRGHAKPPCRNILCGHAGNCTWRNFLCGCAKPHLYYVWVAKPEVDKSTVVETFGFVLKHHIYNTTS